MVVHMSWSSSYVVVVISICVLSAAIVLLMCCLCLQGRKKQSAPQFYLLDDAGLRKVTKSEIMCEFDRFDLKTSPDRKFVSSLTQFRSSPFDLTEIIHHNDSFKSSKLELLNGNDNDDMKSCKSNNSNTSFCSIPNMVRSISLAETMKSAKSYADLSINL